MHVFVYINSPKLANGGAWALEPWGIIPALISLISASKAGNLSISRFRLPHSVLSVGDFDDLSSPASYVDDEVGGVVSSVIAALR